MSVEQAFHKNTLSISQRPTVIRFTEKKGRDKWYVKNWRAISSFNVCTKILSKPFSEKIKSVLPNLISSQKKSIY